MAVEPAKSEETRPAKTSQGACASQFSAFMQACRLEKSPFTPIWLMRQAGRYLPSYRKVRDQVGFLQLCKSPQLAAEVTVNAVEELGVDAAIIFADILLLLEPLGAELEFAQGEGPIIHNPVATAADVERMAKRATALAGQLDYVMQAITLARRNLPAHIPLIGFAGAPFTLASYLIEGGSSRNFQKTKTFMYQNPRSWQQLMQVLSQAVADYLHAQADAGAQAVQLFDSWVGCLAVADYEQYVQEHMIATISSVASRLPVIHFGTTTAHLLPQMALAGSQVIGLDWRVKLDSAWQQLGSQFAVQGNLDPVLLFADKREIKRRVEDILAQAGGRPGHIFNLGHGVLPGTPVEHVKYLIKIVHELSQV